MKKFLRHGDVNLHEVKELKGKRLKTNGRYILARGEATNSVHEICVKNQDNLEVYEHEGTIFLKVMEPAEITHTHDHETIILQPGIYKQVQEREYSKGVPAFKTVAEAMAWGMSDEEDILSPEQWKKLVPLIHES